LSGLLLALVGVGVFTTAAWLTARVRAYAVSHGVLDVPNHRSSHRVATPRGGGIAIAAAVLAGWGAAAMGGLLSGRQLLGLAVGGAVVTAVGFADDHRHLSRLWRLGAHLAAAACVVAGVGGIPTSGPGSLPGGDLLWAPLSALYLAWLVNLTNFMDGIDGLAAGEAATVAAGGAWLAYLTGTVTLAPAAVLACGAAGFLVWNWPPARIFMGDAGSGFLGLALGGVALHAGQGTPALFWGWTILLGVFIVDASVTLCRRVVTGARFYEPHRTHAYQKLSTRVGGHRPVTLAVMAINLGWLLPIAALVARGQLSALGGLALAYAPLLAGALVLRAGAGGPEQAMPTDPTYN
jgi:Fuc2NAc and GlcNAc transferase